MKRDAFSQCHPAVNFLFFVGAIGFGVVIQHPAYLTAGVVCSGIYYFLLHGEKGIRNIALLLPVFVIIAAVNPLFNTLGATPLFYVFSRPYTLEALLHGAAVGAIFLIMMLWFGCYNAVLTSDKFTALFGSIIPSLSLLLVMVLRMIPNLMRKAVQLATARGAIGKGAGEHSARKQKVNDGLQILSGLTDWALEGSIVTADSMRARGYGCAKRTCFQLYRMRLSDWLLLIVMLLLSTAVLLVGAKSAEYTPQVLIAPLSPAFAAYCIFLLIPTMLHIKEVIRWHCLRSRI